MRGAHAALNLASLDIGLIPARAGSTKYGGSYSLHTWAHPRPCGEHAAPVRFRGSAPGSSPPVRGAQNGIIPVFRDHGLIPARAGSTTCHIFALLLDGAHPRPCGEHLESTLENVAAAGSSPPVRGAPERICIGEGHRGLIPARAGSTLTGPCRRERWWAHPRPCGEHLHPSPDADLLGGSSPPVRGARK